MDPTQLIQQGGIPAVLAVLVILIGYLLNSNRLDRKAYREAVADADRRADAAEARERLKQQELDKALADKRAAEDREAKMAREVASLSERVDHLSGEVARLRSQLGLPL